MTITIRPLETTDRAACDAINRSLPDWFGLEEGLEEAREYLETHPGLVAEENGAVVGYLTYTHHNARSAEISWMAVAASHHRRGGGSALIDHLVRELAPNGTTMLSVKTLADTHPSPEYAITRAFYESLGFQPLMVLPDLWDPSNPCLIMVRVTRA